MHDTESLDELGWSSCFIDVTFGTGRDGFENALVVHAGTGHDDAEVGTNGLHTGHNVVEVLAAAVAKQHEIDGLQLAEIGERGRDELEIRFGIKESPESHKTQWIAFHYGDTDERLSGYGSFHQDFPVRIASCYSLPEGRRN